MQQLTAEDKARVFGMYLGATAQRFYRRTGIDSNMSIKVKTVDIHAIVHGTGTYEYKLILKPLSKISDEDAIEVARLAMGKMNMSKFRIKQIGFAYKLNLTFGDIHPTIFCIDLEVYIPVPGAERWYPAYCVQIDTEIFDVTLGNYLDDGKGYEDGIPDNMVEVIDFLRSRSYALPYRGIDLFEAGIAIEQP